MSFAVCGLIVFGIFRGNFMRSQRLEFGEATLVEKFFAIQHRLNPLHVYCRFVDRGLSKRFSASICKAYENFIFFWISLFIKTVIYLFGVIINDIMVQE